MTKQKYKKGDRVRSVGAFGSRRGGAPTHLMPYHLKCGTIVGSYHDQYGGGNKKSYTVKFDGFGTVSWEEEESLIPEQDGENLAAYEVISRYLAVAIADRERVYNDNIRLKADLGKLIYKHFPEYFPAETESS